MKRAVLFCAASLAVFVAPYILTEREVFFPRASARSSEQGARSEAVVRAFLAALPEAYRTGSTLGLLPMVYEAVVLDPLREEIEFLARRGRRLELVPVALDLSARRGPDGLWRVHTRERWRHRERPEDPERESRSTAVFLFARDDPRIVAWEVSP